MAPSLREIQDIADAWADAGLDPEVFGPIDEALRRRAEIEAEARALAATAASASKDIAARLASGEITVAEAYAEYARTTAGDQRVSVRTATQRAQVILDAARRAVIAEAISELRKLGDAWITEHLAPAHDALVAEVAKLEPKVEGINDDQGAMRAGPKVAAAWATICDAATQRARLLAVRRSLYRAGIVRPPGNVPKWALAVRHPDRLPMRPKLVDARGRTVHEDVHPARALADLVASGAEPCIATTEEIEKLAAQPPEELPQTRRSGVTWIRDGIDKDGQPIEVPIVR